MGDPEKPADTRAPETIESEIEATRERLGNTIDQLLYRSSPKTIVKREVDGFKAFLDEWVFGVRDRTEYIQHYIQKLGYSAFKALQAEFDYGYPVSYAY